MYTGKAASLHNHFVLQQASDATTSPMALQDKYAEGEGCPADNMLTEWKENFAQSASEWKSCGSNNCNVIQFKKKKKKSN